MFESDTQHRQPLGPLPWYESQWAAVVNAFSVDPKPKWKPNATSALSGGPSVYAKY